MVGSPNDLPKLRAATAVLEELEVPYEVVVASAHRTPEKAATYAARAAEKGLEVIIAGAGLAAHLPGVVAAHTHLPVIGVPLSGGSLGGLDALLSVVQMPSGVPVATVGIDAFKNAALLAASILALKDRELAERLKDYRQRTVADLEAEAERRIGELWGAGS
ncbi:MAG: 5-(carboxyamino)imidazole ribonucleotide mutase [Moorellales bacterium]